MSIAPPSDIVLDVAQAADPRRVQAAAAKLAGLASGTGAAPDSFASALAGVTGKPAGGAVGPPPPAGADLSMLDGSRGAGVRRALTPYQRFEAVLLQNVMQEMLPKDDKLFGDAASADAYRGLMAEQLADGIARAGGIGIARMIEKAHAAAAPRPEPATPPVGKG